ncbi:MAG: helix-turn-helix domain-containing protein [Anaerolineae bacterium]|nr:helix-turn-helix domain-containing protein [Anaerolineae bacterium]MDW8298905.1 helix-turn-helix domain-containing protein [Anaerolineae bacterium]
MFQRLKIVTHPVRIRICQALHRAKLSTTQLHALLKDVPKPSLYRHLRILLENGLIQVAETHLVNGIEERIYTVNSEALDITQEDIDREISNQQLAEFALAYINGVSSEFAEYILAQSQPISVQQLLFHDFHFFATDEEFVALRRKLWQMFSELEARPPQPNQTRRRFLIVAHPSQVPMHSSTEADRDQKQSIEESSDETE